MKYFIFLLIIGISLYSCDSNKKTVVNNSDTIHNNIKNDTIRIANDELEYEIIIFEPGFQAWLATQPPMGYNGITYLESRNRIFVITYNNRVIDNRSRQLYEQEINYDSTVHYGLEVNYLLYNYFIYFQQKYKQKL